MHSSISRRQFAGAAAFLTAGAYSRILGANERLHIGVIGAGGMATAHMKALLEMKDSDNVEIIAVCDVYDKRRDDAAKLTSGSRTKTTARCSIATTSTTPSSPCPSIGIFR
jgi:ornithine cyclodeaminase/alanine dehydrogenase-like protein (mu-crystallin family)